jgi:Fic family protein
MFLEKRKSGKNTKFYLVQSFRDTSNKVIKIRRFLGSNLSENDIRKLSIHAKAFLEQKAEDMKLKVFDFSLKEKEIQKLNKISDKIIIKHLKEDEWKQFTENFTYDTNAIEGSTVLRDEVGNILQKKTSKNSDEIETKSVAKAIGFIRTAKEDLSINLILKLHKLCFEGSKPYAGKFREVEVVIRDREGSIIHRGASVENLPSELVKFVDWYHDNKAKFKPLVLAAIVHNQFETIHPFQDGNGRVGRLLLNFVLVKHKYPPINISLEDRGRYYHVLQEYQKNDKLKPTLEFLFYQYKKTLSKVTTKKKK